MMPRRRNTGFARVWTVRAAVAITLGVVVGFLTGAGAVHFLQPAASADANTPAVDTVSRKPRRAPVAANANNEASGPSVANGDNSGNARDSAATPRGGTLVPKVVGLEEGDARLALANAGFSIGSVLFKSGSAPMGTVIASFPVQGEAVQLPATINLTLSDGRSRGDTTAGAFASRLFPFP